MHHAVCYRLNVGRSLQPLNQGPHALQSSCKRRAISAYYKRLSVLFYLSMSSSSRECPCGSSP